ncbi:MAG: EAL domain-containing protein [Minwuia sp.]|nr:EAL domain-containing protein [Minwuia sp.]
MEQREVEGTDPISILYIDDDYEDFLLTEAMLSSKGRKDSRKDYHLSWAESADSGFATLQETNPDVCLVDYRLGGDNGLDFVRRIVESGFNGPVILLTGMSNEELDQAARGAGAVDYLVKRDVNATLLTRAIQYGLRQKSREKALSRQATTDDLTGARNRVAFDRELERVVATNRRSGNAFAVILLDLDHFRPINDGLGEEAGDRVLVEVSNRLRTCCREADVIARWGGDEFAIICEGLESAADASILAERIRTSIAEPFVTDDGTTNTTCSLGIYYSQAGSRDFDNLVRRADQALFKAKKAGRNRVAFFDEPMNEVLAWRAGIRSLAEAAVVNGSIGFASQPIVSMERQSVEGLEVLMRLQDDSGKTLPAEEVVSVAMGSELIWDVTRLALKRAAEAQAAFADRGDSGSVPFVGINLAYRQLTRPDVLERLERLVAASGIAPATLEFDISEKALASDTDRTLWIIDGIHRLGARVALDDFGTGDMSLTQLARLPVDRLKIDRSLVRDAVRSPSSRAICEGILKLSRSLSISTVAEGVEIEAEARLFRANGCDMMQGKLSGAPEAIITRH